VTGAPRPPRIFNPHFSNGKSDGFQGRIIDVEIFPISPLQFFSISGRIEPMSAESAIVTFAESNAKNARRHFLRGLGNQAIRQSGNQAIRQSGNYTHLLISVSTIY
jgi:hypothetical protein